VQLGRTITIAAFLAVCLVAAALYFGARTPQPQPMRAEQVIPLGEFSPIAPPRPAPEARFAGHDGKPERLADFRGHWVLVNLWATWCAPCIKEMPSLDRLQAKLGTSLDVIAISEDRQGTDAVAPFVSTLKLVSLEVALDPPGLVASAFQVQGLPTSFLIDPQGRIVAQLQGAADWDADQTQEHLTKLMAANQAG
jgi:thiol-disulfide isomerase/thioredoxin